MAKTYAEYLKESRERPPSEHLAPVGAMPKISKGDSHKYRFKLEKMKRNKEVFKEKLPINIDGTINKAGLRRLRRGK